MTWAGCSGTAATTENVEALWKLIREEAQITVEQIKNVFGIDSTATDLTLRKYPDVRKQYTRWVAHVLTEEQEMGRMQWCHFMLHKFSSG